jgi:hypothetical protein
MKRLKALFFSIPSVLTLVVFTLSSCGSPFMKYLPQKAEKWAVQVGKGSPYYLYLDDDYQPITDPVGLADSDPGKTAVVVLDNPDAEGVALIAETSPGTVDDVVRIINKNNNSVISMFFHKDQRFPWSFDLQMDGKNGKAYLSQYNYVSQSYSITFKDGENYASYENLKLHKSIVIGNTDDAALTADQNTRLRHIATALGLYVSIFMALDETGNIAVVGFWTNPFAIFFAVVAVIAFAVVIILAPPAAITLVGLTLTVPITTVPAAVAAGIGMVATVGSVLSALLIPDDALANPAGPPDFRPPSAPEPALVVSVKTGGLAIDPGKLNYLEKNADIVFDFSFIGWDETKDIQLLYYDPVLHKFITPPNYNSGFFDVTQSDGSPVGSFLQTYSIKIKRNTISGTGYNDGAVDFVVYFAERTVINDSSAGILFQTEGDDAPVLRHDVLPLHFTVIDPDL